MSTILLSFENEWFEFLKTGQKKFEYRKHFPEGENTTVYFYVNNPIKAICGIAKLGQREKLSDWAIKYQDRSLEVRRRIDEFMSDCRYAMPVLEFQMTNLIPLKKLQEDIPNFVVPRMYYYLDNLDLLKYLEKNLNPVGKKIVNDFINLKDFDIC